MFFDSSDHVKAWILNYLFFLLWNRKCL